MNRRCFLRTATGAAAVVAFPAVLRSASSSSRRTKPNLVVFLPDQQRADTLACYGSGRTHAPNLNKLAAESVVFDRTYVTHPVCTPSRSSLLTGTWPHQNGCTQNNAPLDARHLCLPELLGGADYRTAYMGKWHLGDEVFAQHGFKEWVSIEDMYQAHFSPGRDRTAISDYSQFLIEQGHKPDQPGGTFGRRYASDLPIELSKPVFLERRACDFIARHRHEPFVLFVSFLEPHSPYHGPLDHEHRDDEIEFNASVAHVFGVDLPLRYRLRQEYCEARFGAGPDDFRPTKRNYSGLVTQVDRSIGAILFQLEKLGLSDNTLIVHTSDHGDMMGDHRLFYKGVMFEPSARVPYLVRLPGQRRSVRVAQVVSHIDFVPTLLDLLGRPEHPQCVGRSLAPLMHGETMPAGPVFTEWSPNSGGKLVKPGTRLATAGEIERAMAESTRAVVSPDGWKLCLRDTGEHELYQLRDDPLEMHNLYHRSEHVQLIANLMDEIRAWQASTGDKLNLA